MTRSLVFFCAGTPIGQGSKRVVRGMMIEDAKHARPWRQAIVAEALTAMDGTLTFPEAVRVNCIFYFRRPNGHFGTGKNAGIVKENAPTLKTSKPDIDKLVRAVLDALTIAGVLLDDRQVASLQALKRYADPDKAEGVRVLVSDELA